MTDTEMTDAPPRVAPDYWLNFCTFANQEFADDRDPGLDAPGRLMRDWDNFRESEQVKMHDGARRIAILADALVARTRHVIDTSLVEPDPSVASNYDAFVTYVSIRKDIKDRRKIVVAALKDFRKDLTDVFIAGRLSDELGKVLLLWLQRHQLRLDNLISQDSHENSRLGVKLATIENRRNAGQLSLDWTNAKYLGSGAYGEAGLFLRLSTDGRVIDRVAVKDATATDNWQLWNDAVTEPTEVTSMLRLGECLNSDNVVKLRNWALKDDKSRYKLYLDFCAHGDLEAVAQNYFKPYHIEHVDWVPEPFAWDVLESLVKVGLLMLQGDLQGPVPNWTPMIHRDLKYQNVFLDKNTTNKYRQYPLPRLGDFGLTVFPEAGYQESYAFNQRVHYMAPEVCNSQIVAQGQTIPSYAMWPAGAPRTKISSKADVWGVGETLWTLLVGSGPDPAYAVAQDDNGRILTEKTYSMEPLTGRYSAPLIYAITACMRFQPAARPTFQELFNYIKQYTGSSAVDTDHSQGMREGTADFPLQVPLGFAFAPDQFGIGTNVSSITLPGGLQPIPPPGPSQREPGDPLTPDTVLFGLPGRTYG